MKQLRQFDTLVIEELVKDVFHQPNHGQTYYELAYIMKGRGTHILNSNKLPYSPGDLFLISPEDTHYFDIRTTTHFVVIKFTDTYFSGRQYPLPGDLKMCRPEMMMRNKVLKENKPQLDPHYRSLLKNVIQNIVLSARGSSGSISASSFVFCQMLSLFELLKEAMDSKGIPLANSQPDKKELISYINEHIYDPAKISIKNLSATFHISPHYFSVYFSRKFGISYRSYMNSYRIKLIENRIISGFGLRQIAEEFGFNDESHLSHFFRKQTSVSITQFRAARKAADIGQ